LSKRSISVKKPAGWKKFFNFKCNFLSWASLDFFPVKVHDQGFQKWYVTSACRAVLSCESVLKTPKYTAKTLQSHSHFTLPPFFTIRKNLSFYKKFLKIYALMLKKISQEHISLTKKNKKIRILTPTPKQQQT
jgi:hypothetical protein